ncbi:nuclear transport factor 2 family protein [Kribbella sp. NPDC048915]|uniref:nuclear transport factor 2 family protein n=1 Tax=Kribbella sp. NPDC048915 TaxID=3155148 RepID=UPI0033E13051
MSIEETHTVTNPRPAVDGDKATLWALVEARHVRAAAPDEFLLLKNTYDVELVRDAVDADLWRIRIMTIRNVWFEGRPEVLFGSIPS